MSTGKTLEIRPSYDFVFLWNSSEPIHQPSVLVKCFAFPIKKQQVTAKQRGAPQCRLSNQEERQSCREPKVAHIPAPITAELSAISNVLGRQSQQARHQLRIGWPGSMHYERAALLSGVYRVDAGQESEEKIGKSAEEWHFTLRERLR